MIKVGKDVRQTIGANGAVRRHVSPVASEAVNRVDGVDPCLTGDAETRESLIRYAEPKPAEFVFITGTIEPERFVRWLD